jgi:hypothetical protein
MVRNDQVSRGEGHQLGLIAPGPANARLAHWRWVRLLFRRRITCQHERLLALKSVILEYLFLAHAILVAARIWLPLMGCIRQ